MEKSIKTIADSRFTLSALMGPQDANAQGNVHGGVIMKMVDEAGALVAMRHFRTAIVTVAIDSMTFVEPIFVGNLVLCSAELTYVGRTSMETQVEVIAQKPLHGTSKFSNIAFLVYVTIDANGQPIPVPEVKVETDLERARAQEARERQALGKRQRI